MLLAVLLAAVCLEAPTFELDGPACTAERLRVPCGCTDGFTWDELAGADRYEIERETVSSGTRVLVGTVPARLPAEEGDVPNLLVWWFARDSKHPHAGTLYRYRARGCNAAGCGGWSDPVEYVGADYACYDRVGEIACYVGDEVVSR